MKDYYGILGVSRTASHSAIRDAYRRLAKRYHPDVNSSPQAEQIFKEVNEAYEVLSDPDKRAEYDQPTLFESSAPQQPVHRDPYFRRKTRPHHQSDTERLRSLVEEYKPVFLWICKIGVAFSILMALDALIPPSSSDDVIAQSIYYRGTNRSSASYAIVTNRGRRFNWYPEEHYKINLDVNSQVSLKISRIFSSVLTVKLADGNATVWLARVYTKFVFFPIILLISSCIGILFRANANLVLNCGTISFVLALICLFLVL